MFEFEKLEKHHLEIIFSWLAEPHMLEFWDNSQEHKDDIINFVDGRKKPSAYFSGNVSYWIGTINKEKSCFILTSPLGSNEDCPKILAENRSVTGATYCIDFGIGNREFLGKGFASEALCAFIDFFRKKVDPAADTFFIDPDANNPRAQHVYTKAGFRIVGNYIMDKGVFEGQRACLMVQKFEKK
ncbi:GNAT family N-acetyltransferase [Legionella quinlivanii]|uniref:GNAT family N-acetyltransferase n=1 Tax=Legionella quinlivanii TaxID=45073 RepID=A0A364LMI7_9GAMM|nr:GNAT family N-acetyltransferase [Legionella quinlivanii]RAP38024.1 GNAT family N-acetyltransferase [Legionella quinlivanii]